MRGIAALLGLLVIPSAQARSHVPDAAMNAVRTYSNALVAADCAGVYALSAVTRRHPETKESLCQGMKAWKEMGVYERLREPTSSLASGVYRMVVVPNSRISVDAGRPVIANGLYVAISGDSGRTWQVIDIACDQLPKWVQGLYPPYDGHPSLSLASVDRFDERN